MELKVNPEYERILPKLSEEEYEVLKNSIKEDGQLYPIIVNEEDVILDGHHRYKACKELGIEPKIERRTFQDKLLEKKFVIEVNLKRRHLLPFQKAEMGMALLEIERELAKQRKAQAEGKKRGEKALIASIEAERGKAIEIVAKKIGLSRATFERAVKIIERAPEFVKEKARRGEITVYEGERIVNLLEQVEDEEKRNNLIELLENEEITTNDLGKIVVSSKAAISLCEDTPEVLEEFQDKLWTPELDLTEIKKRVDAVYGIESMKELVVIGWKFKSEQEATNWARALGGNLKEVRWVFEFPEEVYEEAKRELERR